MKSMPQIRSCWSRVPGDGVVSRSRRRTAAQCWRCEFATSSVTDNNTPDIACAEATIHFVPQMYYAWMCRLLSYRSVLIQTFLQWRGRRRRLGRQAPPAEQLGGRSPRLLAWPVGRSA